MIFLPWKMERTFSYHKVLKILLTVLMRRSKKYALVCDLSSRFICDLNKGKFHGIPFQTHYHYYRKPDLL